MNVLIVDDSAVMRTMILKTLKLSGLPLGAVHQAGDGSTALSILAEHQVNLVLLDLNMPGMRGDELIERIRDNPATSDLRILVISSDRSPARLEQVGASGAAYLPKPFTPEGLSAAVHQLAGRGA